MKRRQRRRRPWTRHHTRAAATVAVLLLLLLGVDRGEEVPAASWSRRELLDAIRFVESGHRDRVPDGDGGLAIGPYQIHSVYWQDAVKFRPELGGGYQDCRRRDYAERVIAAYMQMYVPAAWQTIDAEVIARTHNGGPRGADKSATERYWLKVQRARRR